MTKKAEAKKSDLPKPVASKSKMPKGTGSRRTLTRVITVYGPAKSRKTTSLAKLPMGRTKWLASDANCVPTLRSLGRLPHEDDLYELNSLEALREFLDATLKLAEDAVTEGKDPRAELGIDFLVLDSWTQYFDWHQADTAKATGQRYMGDNEKDNGWVRFNAEFGACLDLWAALGRYITCISIVHAKDKFDPKKGEYASFSLSPEMSRRLGRLSNWILLKTFEEVLDDAKLEEAKANPEDPYYETIVERGETRVYENLFHTRPVGNFIASVNADVVGDNKFRAEEPGGDICYLLEKDGLM